MSEQRDEAAWLERGRWLFAGECEHVIAVPSVEFMPAATLPEVVFIGRSNVGKSSLVNGLTGRGTLARTSNTPGRTQMLHFYRLRDQCFLVDMPGYGFAQASKKDAKGWQQLIYAYLRGRLPLRRGLLLIDSRHGANKSDQETMKFLDDMAVPYQLVLTKADKLKTGEQKDAVDAARKLAAKHGACLPEPILTSAEKGTGMAELRAMLADIVS